MHDLLLRTLIACATFILTVGPVAPAQAQSGSEPSSAQHTSLFQVIQQTDSLATFSSTLRVAGLAGLMKRDGPFTVFAPTEAAFESLPESTFAPLLRPENRAQLRALLKYHIVEGRLTAADLNGPRAFKTLQGAKIGVDSTQAAVTLTDGTNATVTTIDLPAANGVLHLIDAVLIPPEKTAANR